MSNFVFSVFSIWAFIFILFALFYTASTLIGLIRVRGVPFVPLSKSKMKFLVENVFIEKDKKVAELGCGDGRVMRLFEQMGVIDVKGFEVNWWAVLKCKILNKIYKSKTKIFNKNFRKVNLEEFDVVFCYLLDTYLSILREQFSKELKKGTKIISFDFPIPNWLDPVTVFESKVGKIFIYEKK